MVAIKTERSQKMAKEQTKLPAHETLPYALTTYLDKAEECFDNGNTDTAGQYADAAAKFNMAVEGMIATKFPSDRIQSLIDFLSDARVRIPNHLSGFAAKIDLVTADLKGRLPIDPD